MRKLKHVRVTVSVVLELRESVDSIPSDLRLPLFELTEAIYEVVSPNEVSTTGRAGPSETRISLCRQEGRLEKKSRKVVEYKARRVA